MPMMDKMLTAQTDDPELFEWLLTASNRGGGFVSSFARAALCADGENYPLIRPLLLTIRDKYPEYKPGEGLQRELRERMKR